METVMGESEPVFRFTRHRWSIFLVPTLRVGTLVFAAPRRGRAGRDAERPNRRSHAERGRGKPPPGRSHAPLAGAGYFIKFCITYAASCRPLARPSRLSVM